jgi:response regulator RpfG family c-di-GMP phosphodiesterase
MVAPCPGSREVLIVEDEVDVRQILAELFEALGYACRVATNGQEGLEAFISHRPAVVVTDMRMPVMGGMDLVVRIREIDLDAALLVLSAHGDVKMAVECLKAGADDFLTKPFDLDEVAMAAERALERRQLLLERRQHQALVHQRVSEATRELGAMLRELEEAQAGTLRAFGALLDARNAEPAGHCQRLLAYSLAIARAHGLGADECAAIEAGSPLHDIGKLAIPESILLKPGPLSPEERQAIQMHPELGQQFLESIPTLRRALPLVYHHHERWDGSGYPLGLSGEAIPLGARIFAIAEAFETVTVDRPYPQAVSVEEAREEIVRQAGTLFDPGVVESFLAVPAETLNEIRHRTTDVPAPPASLAAHR